MSVVDANGDARIDLNPNSWVRVGTIVAALTVISMGYAWLDSRFTRIENTLRAEGEQTASTMRAVESAATDRWTRTDQRLLLLEFQIRNPKMNIPLIAASK